MSPLPRSSPSAWGSELPTPHRGLARRQELKRASLKKAIEAFSETYYGSDAALPERLYLALCKTPRPLLWMQFKGPDAEFLANDNLAVLPKEIDEDAKAAIFSWRKVTWRDLTAGKLPALRTMSELPVPDRKAAREKSKRAKAARLSGRPPGHAGNLPVAPVVRKAVDMATEIILKLCPDEAGERYVLRYGRNVSDAKPAGRAFDVLMATLDLWLFRDGPPAEETVARNLLAKPKP